MRFRISKRTLWIVAPIIIFLVLCGGAFVAAKTGHFPKLAKVLNIKADTTTAFPERIQVCGAGLIAANGTYIRQSNTLYQMDGKPNSFMIQWGAMNDYYGNWYISFPGSILVYGYRTYPNTSPVAGRSIAPGVSGWDIASGNYSNLPAPIVVPFGENSGADCKTPDSVEIDATVKDADTGAVLHGVKVSMQMDNPQDVITGSNGRFSHPNLPAGVDAGNYWINFSLDGYVPLGPVNPTYYGKTGILTAGVYDLGTIKMQKNAGTLGVVGKIVDPKGKAIPKIKITVSCESGSCSKDPKGPWEVETTADLVNSPDSNRQSNFKAMGLSDITSPASADKKFKVTITIPEGMYVDSNNNNINDDNWPGYFELYGSDFNNLVDGVKSAYTGLVLKPDTNIRLYGAVSAYEDRSIKLDATVTLGIDPNVPQFTTTTTDGNYDLSNLKGKIQLNKKYIVKVFPKTISGKPLRSSSYSAVTFTAGSKIRKDFYLPISKGGVVFEGNLNSVDKNGNALAPIIGGDVVVKSNGFAQAISTTDKDGHYKIDFTDFYDSADSLGKNVTVSLVAFAGASNAALSQEVSFTLKSDENVIIFQDFNFEGNLTRPDLKDISLTFIQQLRTYTGSSADGTAQYTSTESAMPDLSVTLQSTVASDNSSTDLTGFASFSKFPKLYARIIVDNLPAEYNLVSGYVLSVSALQTSRAIKFWKWDLPPIDQIIDDLSLLQKDPSWANLKCPGFGDKPNGEPRNFGNFGCGITSLVNAIRYYNPGLNVTPKMVYDLAISKGLNCSLEYDESQKINNYQKILDSLKASYPQMQSSTFVEIPESKVAEYVNGGHPVLWYTLTMEGHNTTDDQTHVVMIYKVVGGRYTISDPSPHGGRSAQQNLSRSEMGTLRHAYVVINDQPATSISTGRTAYRSSSTVAQAADSTAQDATSITINDSADLKIWATIHPNSVFGVGNAFVVYKKGAEIKYYKMNKSTGEKYIVAIPQFILTGNFSYHIQSMNSLGIITNGQEVSVIVNKTPDTVVKRTSMLWSNFTTSVSGFLAKDSNSTTNATFRINSFITTFLTGYYRALSFFHINLSGLAKVKGNVFNSNYLTDSSSTSMVVKIGNNIGKVNISSDGDYYAYEIKDIIPGTYKVVVYDTRTGKNLNLGSNFYPSVLTFKKGETKSANLYITIPNIAN